LRELGILPSVTLAKAQEALNRDGLAFVPTQVIAPGIASLLALRQRLGGRNSAHTLIKMVDPFDGDSLRLVSVSHPDYLGKMRAFFNGSDANVLLLRGTEGEPYANAKRRPRLEYVHDGMADVLFEAEHESLRTLPNLPEAADAALARITRTADAAAAAARHNTSTARTSIAPAARTVATSPSGWASLWKAVGATSTGMLSWWPRTVVAVLR